MVNITKTLGEKLRKKRMERELTQEEVAYKSELDYSYYNQIENGRRNPSIEAIERIAKALGMSVKDLF